MNIADMQHRAQETLVRINTGHFSNEHKKAIRHIEPMAKRNGSNTSLNHKDTATPRIRLPSITRAINKATIEKMKLTAIVEGGNPFKKKT
jgi:hypothetical protein